MKTYVMSDIHGRTDLFDEMLSKIDFSKDDKLYILGDICDRGGGLDTLIRVKNLCTNPTSNIELIMGNHEKNLLDMLVAFYRVQSFKSFNEVVAKIERLENSVNSNKFISLLNNVARVSLKQTINPVNVIYRNYGIKLGFTNGFIADDLNKMEKNKTDSLIKFLIELKTYKKISVNGKDYILVHGGYSDDQKDNEEYLLTIRDTFFDSDQAIIPDNTTVIFGHTTTRDIRAKIEHQLVYPYTIWHGKNKIGIDCAASFVGGRLACLRLDDMQEFYVDNKRDCIVPVSIRNEKMRSLWEYEKKVVDKYRDIYDENDILFNRNK